MAEEGAEGEGAGNAVEVEWQHSSCVLYWLISGELCISILVYWYVSMSFACMCMAEEGAEGERTGDIMEVRGLDRSFMVYTIVVDYHAVSCCWPATVNTYAVSHLYPAYGNIALCSVLQTDN